LKKKKKEKKIKTFFEAFKSYSYNNKNFMKMKLNENKK